MRNFKTPKRTENEMNKEVFKNTFMPYLDDLYGISRLITGDRDRSETLVEDAYKVAFAKRNSFNDQGNAKTWIIKILIDAFKNNLSSNSIDEIFYKDLKDYIHYLPNAFESNGGNGDDSWLDYNFVTNNLHDFNMCEVLFNLPLLYRVSYFLMEMHDLNSQDVSDILEVDEREIIKLRGDSKNLLRYELQRYLQDPAFHSSYC